MKIIKLTQRNLRSSLLLSVLLSSLVAVALFSQRRGGAAARDATPGDSAATAAVLVELFTSEGCSSCPPADKLLIDLDQNQPIKGVEVIALSEHVDYWNRLGWKDPYSSAEFSRRQNDYSRVLGGEDIYTPQMIVDGRTAFIGSQRAAALDAITKAAHAPKASVSVITKAATAGSITLALQIENIPDVSRGDRAEVMLAITEDGLLSKVTRGENSGRQLSHSSVTRKLIKLGAVEGKTFSAEPSLRLEATWKRQDLKFVAFAQERNSRRVLGAAALKFAGE